MLLVSPPSLGAALWFCFFKSCYKNKLLLTPGADNGVEESAQGTSNVLAALLGRSIKETEDN